MQARRRVFEYIDQVERGAVRGGHLHAFAGLAREYGFSALIICGIPDDETDVESLIALESWPQGWRDRYRAGNYFRTDPVSIAAAVSAAPYSWANARARFATTANQHHLAEEAAGYGMRDGVVFPGRTGQGRRSVVSLASERPLALSALDLGMVYLAAQYCQTFVARSARTRPSHPWRLSSREKEVLLWAAHGKSAWETAQILTISEATVFTHLRNVRRKLGASNTTHAVALALSAGQIAL